MSAPAALPRWVQPLRVLGLLAWLAVPPFVLLVDSGMRWFWTGLVAALPLSWVLLGFHPWRLVCPLATVTQLPGWLGRGGQRKLGEWWAENGILVQLGLMVLALSARLLGANGTPLVLVGGWVLLNLAALAVGLSHRGRTWCNHLCPVGMVERIYTEPIQLVDAGNSQCTRCTACAVNCPDIDLEKGYWQGGGDRRRLAWYTWPGLVLGFYTWFWLQSGNWASYFSGAWTTRHVAAADLLGPGFFFAPAVPWLLSVPLTLLAFGAASLGLFLGLERSLRGRVEAALLGHRMLVLAGFTAFTIFYVFAGQPTIRLLPGWGVQALAFVVWMAGALIAFRRWSRNERDWVRERFARRILKRWRWGDRPEDEDLAEVYVVHAEREREQRDRLAAYGETLRELAADGVLTRDKLSVLDTVRSQLRISDADHRKVLAGLEASDQALFDPDRVRSTEERLQEEQYSAALARLLAEAAAVGAAASADRLDALRVAWGVDAETHQRALARLQDPGGAIAEALDEQVTAIDQLATLAAAAGEGEEGELLRDLCRRRAELHESRIRALLHSLGQQAPPPALEAARARFEGHGDPADLEQGLTAADPLLAAACAWRLGRPTPLGATLDRVVVLRRTGLLRTVSAPELVHLADRVQPRRYAPGEPIYVQGEHGDDVTMLLRGRVRVWRAPDQTLRVMGPGESIGELAVLDPAPRSASVTAVDEVEALVLDGAELRAVLGRQPDVAEGVMRELVRQLRGSASA